MTQRSFNVVFLACWALVLLGLALPSSLLVVVGGVGVIALAVRSLAVPALVLAVGCALLSLPAQAGSSHESWAKTALARVPRSVADRKPERAETHAQNLERFATEIARVSARAPLPPQQWTSLLGAIGGIESNFDTEIVAGRCLPHQCDRGRAKGAFQVQKVGPVAELWDKADGNIAIQVEMADRMLRRSTTRCAPFAPFPNHVFRAYRGGSCSWPVHREAERVALYWRLARH